MFDLVEFSSGTSISESTETLGKSSLRRSSKRVCNTELLHKPGRDSRVSIRNVEGKSGRNCNTKLLHKWPRGLVRRGSTFYHRRRVPAELRPTVGRDDVWKSLRTDSLKCAKRRLPSTAAQVESWFECLRQQVGLTVDQALLKPSSDDPRGSSAVAVQTPPSGPTLGEVYRRYLDDPTHAWSASTRQAYETTRSLAEAIFGVGTATKTPSGCARVNCACVGVSRRGLPC
jgi:hypothetical protein